MAYGRPGVYVNERLLPAPINALGTAQAAGAAVGVFAQGPETVTLVNSWYDFVKKFGGYNASYPATFGVGQFFANGGTELFVRRVLDDDAAAASAVIAPESGSDNVGSVTAKNNGADGNNLRVQFSSAAIAGYYNLVVYREGGASAADSSDANDLIVESFNNLLLDDSTSSDYIETVVNQSSALITVSISDGAIAPATSRLPLTGGSDGTDPQATDYVSAIADFATIDRPLILFAPEITSILGASDGKTVQDALISFAEANNGFAVLDTVADLSVANAITAASGLGAYSNAAVYYPNVFIADPVGRSSASLRKIGPAGSVAGLYLFYDKQTGPFKAPAGIQAVVRGAVALERSFTPAELDSLNTASSPVNAIRNVPGAGIVVMGARTLLQDNTSNRYVNMRRSLIFLKKSLQDLTAFAMFQNNDERLWKQIRTAISVFLNEYYSQGGLRGSTPNDAFFVKCDGELNTASSIANGEVNIQVGVALQYPAEFVVIDLSQQTAA